MTLYFPRAAATLLALSCSSLALAGEVPLYQPAPDWIVPVDMDEVERDPSNDRIIWDYQIRIEDGQRWEYLEEVYRLSSANSLTQVGTISARWLPDKGDLIVHDVTILRDGEAIDVLAQGEEMEVLRRERQLEQQILDGSLTATMSVPGLQVGDELRIAYSITVSDQALDREVQSYSYLWREPSNIADFGRVLVSWPETLGVSYRAGPNFELAEPETRGGFEWLEVALPLPEADEMPEDAPWRFRRPTTLQVGTFDDWAEVSRIMAPYYETQGELDGLDDLISKVEAIRTGYDTDLERAVATLELVQEDIRYLLNGLDGGNYLPQSVATTWENKYGDCKAKTLILLALLDRLGIEAEPVMASVQAGNAVPTSLPVPGAFDHVLVRAQIDGNAYYLDGTSMGANIALVGNVPPFEYVLPIRTDGADIEAITQVLPRVPEFTMTIDADSSAGGDLPTLATMTMEFIGPAAAEISANADKLTEDRKRQMAQSMGSDGQLIDVEIVKGEDDSEVAMVMTLILEPMFDFEGLRGELEPSFTQTNDSFSPDRSRRDWREIPVAIGAASATVINLRATLPTGTDDFELRGDATLDESVAGRRYLREVELEDGQLSMTEQVISLGGEIAAEDISTERRKSVRFARNEFKLLSPEGMPRRWRYAQSDDRSALARLETAYTRAIENDPEEADPYLSRAAFRYDTYDFAGSLEDMNMVVELEGSAENYSQRSTVHSQLLDQDAVIEDLAEAYALEPTPRRAIHYANALFEGGDAAMAREILEGEDGDEDVRRSLADALADIDAFEGKGAEGLARIDAFLQDNPNDSRLLNQKCWYMVTWQVEMDAALDVCTRAVELGGRATILDSRAMAYYRLGMMDEALQDVEAALDDSPDQTASLLLRGIILRDLGDEQGQADIDAALARDPSLARSYRMWGFDI